MTKEELAWVALNLARGANRVAIHEIIQSGASLVAALEDPERRR